MTDPNIRGIRASMTPRIGIVSSFDRDRRVYVCDPAYVRAVEAAGGLPFVLPYHRSLARILDAVNLMVDGVLLTGGTDLDSTSYGGPLSTKSGPTILERDAFELPLVRALLNADIPVLGICRGLQCLNVAAGGSLHTDLPSCLPSTINHNDGRPLNQPTHPVRIEPDSRVALMCGATVIQVNSLHHQAARDVARGFRPCGYAPDGVIEAIESTQHRFAIGVQWHPEFLWESDPACRALFMAFVEACIKDDVR